MKRLPEELILDDADIIQKSVKVEPVKVAHINTPAPQAQTIIIEQINPYIHNEISLKDNLIAELQKQLVEQSKNFTIMQEMFLQNQQELASLKIFHTKINDVVDEEDNSSELSELDIVGAPEVDLSEAEPPVCDFVFLGQGGGEVEEEDSTCTGDSLYDVSIV